MKAHSISGSDLLPVPGIRLAAIAAGIRYQGRNDLALIEIAQGSNVIAVFTRNRFCAAPVTIAKRHLSQTSPRFLVINSGNANAGTGARGLEDAERCCHALAHSQHLSAELVLPFSTGVIGERLPADKIVSVFPDLLGKLEADRWGEVSEAIMTTDTVPKALSRQVELQGGKITITGIAKGAGMIHPNMATMLAYIATDARLPDEWLQQWMPQLVGGSFNSITVDGDTSTNDACVLIATGASSLAPVSDDEKQRVFAALQAVFVGLAQGIIRDAEGATKFVTVQVEEAMSYAEARRVADAVALSPLVKTALFASDPNWGRILAAVGRAEVDDLDLSGVTLLMGDVVVVSGGEPAATYTEAEGQRVFEQPEITLEIRLGRGRERAVLWTSDLSHDYVSINAEYRS
ncbi:MAG TPA: bifunctional glutamate N-acetyltransferase/amino-acid acetyltransferase ArgJ [Gammaproteobacteria bacterium]|nr:bifunctional glutamate N-acetyltransferase/amino-acid acetyltransferase ArgJ [Gammaproteobacteria bacterium]